MVVDVFVSCAAAPHTSQTHLLREKAAAQPQRARAYYPLFEKPCLTDIPLIGYNISYTKHNKEICHAH